jgi:hypothetical protein
MISPVAVEPGKQEQNRVSHTYELDLQGRVFYLHKIKIGWCVSWTIDSVAFSMTQE